MRNVHDFRVPFERKFESPFSNTTQTGTVQSVRSQRSDAVSLAPPPYGVTGYEAFFMTASYMSDYVEWNQRWVGKSKYSWTHGELPESVWRAGCNSLLRPDIPGWMLNRVRSSMDSQVRDNLDVSVFAGEARETGRFLVQTLGTILQLLNSLRKTFRNLNPPVKGRRKHYGSFSELLALTVRAARSAASRGDRLAGAYLWYMYAVRPLVSDVIKICKHWDKRLDAPISKRIFAQVEGTFTPPTSANRKVYGTPRYGVKSGADAVVLNPEALRASQYGLTSPLALLWELTTLSFVVDWFTGIGSFLRTLETPIGVAIVNYYETQWVDSKFTYEYDVYSDLYKSQYTTLLKDGKQTTRVRLKCMLRQTSNHILPAPPFLSLGTVGSSQATSILALIVARSSS